MIFRSFALGFATLLLMGVAWNSTFNLAPANSDSVSAGAGEIRLDRVETRNRLHTEHCFGDGFTDSGVGCSGTNSLDNGRRWHSMRIAHLLL